MTDQPADKKIIIDEDWKSRAQAEKEALRMKAEQEEAEKEPPAAKPRPAAEDADEPLPPPTFAMHILSLASQAMIFLGQVPNPMTDDVQLSLGHARHVIDTLAMLEQKTRGNLSEEEARMILQILHELRLGFVEAQKHLSGDSL